MIPIKKPLHHYIHGDEKNTVIQHLYMEKIFPLKLLHPECFFEKGWIPNLIYVKIASWHWETILHEQHFQREM